MDHRRDNLIRSIVRSCEELSETDRARFLDEECVGDRAMRQEVELLINERAAPTEAYYRTADLEKVLPTHYRLVKLIGTGGMADVYLAEDSRLDRRVAIKFLNETFSKDPDRVRRFSQEARSASALNHPNIITIYDIGESDGTQFIVTEFIEGETLGTRIKRGPIPLDETLDIIIQIASALQDAHKVGIIHRDLKPENLMVRPDGSVKILDFGLAKGGGNPFGQSGDLEAKTIEALTTSPGLILGTPQYMSPEQTRGLPLDGRSDIFSLGCVVFEMVTGKTAFTGRSTVDVIAAIIGKEPRQIRDYVVDPPTELIRIVDKALRKDRDDRYLTMEHLLSDLRDLKQEFGSGSGLHPATRRARAPETLSEPRPAVSSRWKWISLPVAAALIVFAWWAFSGRNLTGTTSAGPMRPVPITSWTSSSGESVAAAAFSPDPKMVAFASTKLGSTEIWFKQTSGGEPNQVTKNGFYNQYPVWSPNGEELVFFSQRANNNGLWRTAFTGGKEVQIASGIGAEARPLRWADGKIYLQDGVGGDLFVIDEKTGERKQLTDFASQEIRPRAMAVSQDGSGFAIAVQEAGVWKIKKKLFRENSFTEVTTASGKVDSISFHSNGSSVFYSGTIDGSRQIFRVDDRRSPPLQISSGDTDVSVLDVSSDGTKILFGSVVETSDLWMVDSQTLSESTVANDVPLEYWPDLSPDGKSVAFQSVTQPDRPLRASILVKPLAADTSPTMIATEGILPTWSHDGLSIAFIRRTDAGYGIMKILPTGADAAKLADGPSTLFAPYLGTPYLKREARHISWSPDDGMVAYPNEVDGVSNIWLTMSDGSRAYRLTSNKDRTEKYFSPVWTTDGKYVIFSSETTPSQSGSRTYRLWQFHVETSEQRVIYESANQFIFLGLLAGGEQVAIAEKADAADLSPTPLSTGLFSLALRSNAKKEVAGLNKAYFYNIRLSNDGKTFAFVTRRNNITEVWTMSASGGTPKRILVENDPKNLISTLAWSPDNRSIVFGKQTRTNLLSMLTN